MNLYENTFHQWHDDILILRSASLTHVLSIQQSNFIVDFALQRKRERERERERERLYRKGYNVIREQKRERKKEKKGEITNNLQTGGLG